MSLIAQQRRCSEYLSTPVNRVQDVDQRDAQEEAPATADLTQQLREIIRVLLADPVNKGRAQPAPDPGVSYSAHKRIHVVEHAVVGSSELLVHHHVELKVQVVAPGA